MGGYGSGRTGFRQKAEDCRSLDVNSLKRDGCLVDGWQGHWRWHRNGSVVSKIGVRAEENRLVLDYRVRFHGGEWESISQSVEICKIPCNFGGYRPFFLCPGLVNGKLCGRRVGKLFSGGKYFLCRHCYSISYQTQSEPRHYRLLRRANNIRIALGGEPGSAHLIAPKPRGMWWQTYFQRCQQIEYYEQKASEEFARVYSQLLRGFRSRCIAEDPEKD